MELEELKRMKETVESAAKDVSQSIHESAANFEKSWADTNDASSSGLGDFGVSAPPEYRHPKKHWRVKQAAMPNWYKARTGVRTRALSGAARVARYRPTNYK
jgi:sec-independent protein translocase protein TatB